jgi:formate dehydrogenase iron-sulfur subunit
MCATKALLAGDASVVSDIYRDRVLRRGKAGDAAWGWATAYGKPEQAQERTREQKREGQK